MYRMDDDDSDKIRQDRNMAFLEKLAALEHEQWMAWSKAVYERYGHDDCNQCWLLKKHWEPNWIPYSELPEKIKEFDREWARKVLEIIREY